MPVIARYDFNDKGQVAADSALGNGAQNGIYANGAFASWGRARLDGKNDFVKLEHDPVFQLARGTLEIQFSQTSHVGKGANTILSRDSVGKTQGGFRVEVLRDGSVVVSHEGAGTVTTFNTGKCFLSPCDEVRLTYSWDKTGPGKLQVVNLTTGKTYTAPVPAGLTMDMGPDINQRWMIGADQSDSDPYKLNNLDQFFAGSVEYFQISDTVDNVAPVRDGIVKGTSGNDLIDLKYVDADGDRIDAGDAIIKGDGPDDDRVLAGDGNDTVKSGLGRDTVYGGKGDDLIYGGPGDDVLFGDEGDDTIFGGDGSDKVTGGDGDDYIDTSGGGKAPLPDRGYPGLYPADSDPFNDRDTVYGGNGDDTILTGDDNDLIYGGDGDDLIDGGFDDDKIFGGNGDDTLIGGEGADTIYGEKGDDLIFGGLGPGAPDAVNIRDDQGDLRPDNGTDLLFGGLGDDTIYGLDDADTIYGDEGNDLLDGGIDNDRIFGGAGNDTIIGGQGADTMFGGADRDTFIVNEYGHGIGDVIDGNEEGDDFDTLDLRGAGPLRVTFAPDNPENGVVDFFDGDGNPIGQLSFVNIENVIPCFTPGTMIATPRGEVPVEELKAGDRVLTRDNGIQEIRWFGARHLDWAALCANPHLKPVLIRKGSLGHGLPERDMMVSPNHRMLVANDRTALYFEEHEVLVAAKHLVGARGVQSIDAAGTTYLHMMFDRHEVVLANGAWTESFQPGDWTLKGMGNAQRQEIFELFPDLSTAEGVADYQAARKTLKKHEAALLLR
ncbi:MAG TPA: Hint domain-containing protein [Paracoccaceae bacterium]|nr:Hint domain-containing protein [Paracoccaceae bacterium]HMO84576.1 Hint domain-containing protein [Lacipirellulaceae bacterium]